MTTLAFGEPQDLIKTIEKIRRGIPPSVFHKLAASLDLSQRELAAKLSIVARTIDRQRKLRKNLTAEISEKLLRLERTMALARLIAPDEKAAARWMLIPADALNNFAPIDLLDTDIGAREVEALIIGVGHGNFQ